MLKIKNIQFSYNSDPILKDLSFEVEQGEYLAIIGASGCGKSTLLELIYGLLELDKGEISYENEVLLGPSHYLIPGHSFMKYLPQDFDLMPYITVAENVGKFLSNIYPEKKKARIYELLDVVHMREFADIKVKYLSGGQKQRVALARVLAKEPKVMLLDEPFSHIDNFRKNALRRSLFAYLKTQNITCLVATHDTTDALSFADKTLLIDQGKILAYSDPETLYKLPKSKFEASFFGDVNDINGLELGLSEDREYLIYPHELSIQPQGKLMTVVRSYFKGANYLIELKDSNDQIVFIEHHKSLSKDISVYIGLDQSLPKGR
ncbi:MAG: ABC transporter ATP-binding protein [Flavobacteriaceae bacterium]